MVEEKAKEIIQTNAKLQTIFDNCADGIVIFDSNYKIISANSKAEGLFGEEEKNLKSKNFFEIVINEKNNYFLDSKLNLHYVLEIDLWESILGIECEFKVFDEDIKCNIKPFTKTGDMFLLIGKGYPNGRYKTNLIIEIKVKDLLKLNEEQLELVRKIKNIEEQ
jgi:DnaJ-class molecular chaperone